MYFMPLRSVTKSSCASSEASRSVSKRTSVDSILWLLSPNFITSTMSSMMLTNQIAILHVVGAAR